LPQNSYLCVQTQKEKTMLTKKDFWFISACLIVFAPFFLFESLYYGYLDFNADHGMIMSFLKFAVLATLGEVIGLRIRTGAYNQPGFGIIPRAIVWGFLGLTIKMSFVIFGVGTPVFLKYLGITNATEAMKGGLSLLKIFVAFSISTAMNLIYAPVMMTLHKITDTHIISNGGTIACLFKPIQFRKIFVELNWEVQWSFVFKKTIPFFWIPAHTITFLLPEDFQVLFAAILSIALGVFLAVAAQLSKGK